MASLLDRPPEQADIDSFIFRRWFNNVYNAIKNYSVPTGTILDFAGATAPNGYLLCDGSAVSRTTYSVLFGVIGTTWGVGDGTTTFNIPDLKRRTTIGSGGTGTATVGNALSNTGGEETHVLTIAEGPSHTHAININSGGQSADHTHVVVVTVAGGAGFAGGVNVGGASSTNVSQGASNDHAHNVNGTSASSGSGTAHNNIQPSAVVNKLIRT